MRTTLDICIAVSENQPATEQELRYALHGLSSIEGFIHRDLAELADAVIEDRRTIKMKAGFSKGLLERMFQARKKPMDVWLGEGGVPGSPEQQRRLKWAKGVFKAATGQSLDSETQARETQAIEMLTPAGRLRRTT